MTDPRVGEDARRRYPELLQEIGAALIGAAPHGWRRIDLVAKIVEGVEDFGLTVIMADLSDAVVEPPERAMRAMAELRRVMDVPERGAWLSARYVLDPPGAFQIFYNYDHDPQWDPPLPADMLRRDLEAHPRPPERLGGWLRRVLGLPDPASEPGSEPGSVPAPGTAPEGGSPGGYRVGVEEQRDLVRAVADLLVARAPADREEIRTVYRAAGGHEELTGHVIGVDGRLREWEPPSELPEFFRRLRAGMARDGAGTWSAVSVRVEYPIRTSVDYLYTEDPRWRRPPSRSDVLADLERFPCAPENIPAWMRAVLDEPGTAETAGGTGDPGGAGGKVGAEGAGAEPSARERRILEIIERRVSEAGAVPEAYRILDAAEGAVCLERVGDRWQVAGYERGLPRNPQSFTSIWDAGAYFLGLLTLLPSGLRAGGGDRDTVAALDDWPIQPFPGEPPLTLLTGKHIAVLMPGRRIVRYGPPGGNLVFAAGTGFEAMSLRAGRRAEGPRHYRVVRELRTLAGRTVPWHGRPGGGTAYFLPRSVERHLADGSLAAVPAH